MQCQFISYPKSGRSWVRFALTALGHGQDIAFHHDGFEFNDGSLPAHNFDPQLRRIQYGAPCYVVYLARDPRDIMVSLYHQVTGRFRDFFDYRGTISDFIRDDYFGAHNLRRFQDMWNGLCEEGLALRVSYEDCHDDFAAVLASICDHYGFVHSPAEITTAVEFARFDNMQRIEQSGEFHEPWLRPRNGSPKVRQGKVGGHLRELSPPDIAWLDSMFDECRKVAGLS